MSYGGEVKGKVKSVDAEKNTITVTVGDKDQTIPVAKETEVFSLGKGRRRASPVRKCRSATVSRGSRRARTSR